MLIVMHHGATDDQIRRVCDSITEMGYQARPMPGRQRTTVGLVGNDGRVDGSRLEALPGVQEVIHVSKPYKQVSREWRPEPTVIRLEGGLTIGGEAVVVMAGPCSVESERQILAAAVAVREAGATVLRAGAFKPRSSPYSFQGLGPEGLTLLARARSETGLRLVTEAMDPEGADLVAEVADIIQVGARNMQNYSLLKKVGRLGKPVLLKRGLAATIQDLLLSAEYILAEGNPNVILCERGVRGFDSATRNLFDLSAIPVVKAASHLPIIADPSHGTGHRDMVIPMARAAVAAGADGLLVEVHPNPDRALSDGAQSLYPEQFTRLMKEIRLIADAIGRRVAGGLEVPLLVALFCLSAFPATGLATRPPVPATAQNPDPRPIVEQASRAYQALVSFRADFRQLISDPMIGNFESRGQLTQAGEARLAMRFTDPAGEAIVMDGEHLWVYTPSTTPGQVLRMKVPSDPAYGPNVLAWILTRATERYRSRYLRPDAVAGRAVDVIELTPVDRSLPFTDAVVWLDQFDHLPRKLEIRERGGQQRILTLTAVETNRRVSSSTFRFDIPAGVRVIDQ